MGNQLPSNSLPLSYGLQNNYFIISTNTITNIIYLAQKRTGQQFVMKQFKISSQEEKNQIAILVAHKMTNRCKFLIRLCQKFYEKEEGYCSTQQKIYLIFQRPYKNLRDEIRERKSNNISFSVTQIMQILKVGVLALRYLKQLNQPHQSITSNNFFITRSNTFLLSDPYLNFQSSAFPSLNYLYLSPQKLLWANNLSFQKLDWYSSDLFSLGMVILQIIHLQFMNLAYKKKQINYNWLNKKIQQIPFDIIRIYVKGLLGNKQQRINTAKQIQNFSYQSIHSNTLLDKTNSNNKYNLSKQSSNPTLEQINIQDKTQQISSTLKTEKTQYKNQTPTQNYQIQKQKQIKLSPFEQTKSSIYNLKSKQINMLIDSKVTLQSSLDRVQIINNISPDKILHDQSLSISEKERIEEENLIQSIKQSCNQSNDKQSQRYEECKLNGNSGTQFHLLTYDFQDYSQNVKKQLIKPQLKEIRDQEEVTPPKKQKQKKYNSTIIEVSDSENQSDVESAEIHQFVVQKYQIGSKYEGYKINGMRNGKGKFSYHDGGYYEGQWKNDQMSGFGKLYYPSGKLAYQGEWQNDQFHGLGKVLNDAPEQCVLINYQDFNLLQQQWIFYDGYLISDTKHGPGKIMFSNKQIFQGQFVNDRMQGKGKFYTKDGRVINGLWKQSKLIFTF